VDPCVIRSLPEVTVIFDQIYPGDPEQNSELRFMIIMTKLDATHARE
jgi:hypothetical protein